MKRIHNRSKYTTIKYGNRIHPEKHHHKFLSTKKQTIYIELFTIILIFFLSSNDSRVKLKSKLKTNRERMRSNGFSFEMKTVAIMHSNTQDILWWSIRSTTSAFLSSFVYCLFESMLFILFSLLLLLLMLQQNK